MMNLLNLRICFTIILSFFLFTGSNVFAQGWVPVGPNDFNQPSFYTVNTSSIAADSFGIPYVAFDDYGYASKASVRKYEGKNWTYVGNPGFSSAQPGGIKIALSSSGLPYVAYLDLKDTSRITVMEFNGTTWGLVGKQDFSPANAQSLSLAIDPSGTPYVSFENSDNSPKASVMKFDGSNWNYVGSPNFTHSIHNNVSMAIAPNGLPYITYIDDSLYRPVVMHFNDTIWSSVSTPIFAIYAEHSSISIDYNGIPYVAFIDNSYGWDDIGLVKLENNKWQSALYYDPPTPIDEIFNLQIAIDHKATPYVAFQSFYYSPASITVLKDNVYEMQEIINVDFVPPDAGNDTKPNPSLSVGGTDTAYLSYMDLGNGGKITVQKSGGGPQSGNYGKLVGDKGFSAGGANYTDIEIDSKGTLYAAYQDESYSNTINIEEYLTNTWTNIAAIGGLTKDEADYPCLAIAGNDTPYVAFIDKDSLKIMVMKFNGAWWDTVGNTQTYNSAQICLALDRNSVPYIAFISTNGNESFVNVIQYNSEKWKSLGPPIPMSYRGSISQKCLVFDSQNIPYIVYQDSSAGNRASVSRYNGATWELVGNKAFTPEGTLFQSIAINDSDVLYILYQDNTNQLSVMKYAGNTGSWMLVGEQNFVQTEEDFSFNPKLIVSEKGIPFVSFQEEQGVGIQGSYSDKPNVMYFNGANWLILGDTDFSAGNADYLTLAVDNNGVLYVAYSGFSAWCYKYEGTISTPVNQVTIEGQAKIYPNPASRYLIVENNGNLEKINVSNLFGQTLISQSLKTKDSRVSIDISKLIPGIYFIDISTSDGNKVARFIKD